MSVYGIDPETGLFREPAQMSPVTDEQVSAQRAGDTAQRYAKLDVRLAKATGATDEQIAEVAQS
jgi:hypothetical protein